MKDKLWWADYRARNRTAIRTRHTAYMRQWRPKAKARQRAQEERDKKLAKEFYYSK